MREVEILTCEEVHAQIFALVDCESCDEVVRLFDEGAVDGPDRRIRELMVAHIAACPHCRDVLHAERHVRSLLKNCYEVEVPDALRAAIVQRTTRVSFTVRSARG